MTRTARVGTRPSILAILLILVSATELPAGKRSRKEGAEAPKTLVVDLATQDPIGTRKEPVEAGSNVTVEIRHRLPRGRYNIEVLRQVIEIPAFDVAKIRTGDEKGPRLASCDAKGQFERARTDLAEAKDERLVPTHVSALNALIAAFPSCQVEIDKSQLLIAQTTETVAQHVSLPEGMELIVRVQRLEPVPLQTWEKTFSTGERGRWMTNYGFGFIPSRDRRYFSESSETEAGKFTITRERDRRGFDFTPSVYFTWVATKMLLQNVAWGLTGGLGFDLANPVIFVAPTATYNWNLSLMLGLSMHKERRLRGRYHAGQSIGTNLSNEELTDDSYRPAPFVGFAYRFGSNPFSAPAPGGVVGQPTPTATRTPTPISPTPIPPTPTRPPAPAATPTPTPTLT
jgi:hypothetical protein